MGLAEQAREHWERFRPVQYAQIPRAERSDFFLDLAMQARARITELADQLAGPDRPGETGPEKLGRLSMARETARAQVIREMILPGPEESQDTSKPKDGSRPTS